MRIVLDENVDVALKRNLISLGHRADTSKDADLQGLENGEFLAKARQHYDLLITNDKDFQLQSHLRPTPSLGIVLLRLRSTRFEEQFATVQRLFSGKTTDRLIGRLTILE